MKIPLVFVIVFWTSYFLFMFKSNYKRRKNEDGTHSKARHITLPGYVTSIECESTLDLKRYAGTKVGLISAVTEDGKECPEVTAGIALKTLGAYDDHTLKQNDAGEWILYKPEKRVKHFTWSAHYRIGPWKKDYGI